MTDKSKSEYQAQDKDELVKEAEKRGLVVTRADGDADKEPTKADYVAALEASDAKAAAIPPESAAGPSTGLKPVNEPARPVSGAASVNLPRPKTQEELDAELADKNERAINVRALRNGEYPAGRFRHQGDEFEYHQPQDEKGKAQMDTPLPSWLEAVEDDGPETREQPFTQVPGEPVDEFGKNVPAEDEK